MPRHNVQSFTVKMFYIILLCCVSGAVAENLPFITRCAIDESSCIHKSANAALPYFLNGLPELGVDSMNPMYIPKMTSENAGLKLIFSESYIRGLDTCTVSNVKSELLTKNSHTITFKCSNIVLDSNYVIDGNLLIFAIQGNGKANIDMRDVVMKVSTNLTTVTGKDGKPHWQIVNWGHSFKVQKGAKFDLENLFNGNKAVADTVLQFMNENWKDVLETAGRPIEEAIVGKAIDAAKKLYKYSSKDELYTL